MQEEVRNTTNHYNNIDDYVERVRLKYKNRAELWGAGKRDPKDAPLVCKLQDEWEESLPILKAQLILGLPGKLILESSFPDMASFSISIGLGDDLSVC